MRNNKTSTGGTENNVNLPAENEGIKQEEKQIPGKEDDEKTAPATHSSAGDEEKDITV